jgi:hypothetical protein
MNFYIVLGQSKYPIANQLFTEKEVEDMKQLPQSVNWSFVLIQVPWENTVWSRVGGRGKSPYKGELTTIRVEKAIAYQAQQYAIWLSNQDSIELEN